MPTYLYGSDGTIHGGFFVGLVNKPDRVGLNYFGAVYSEEYYGPGSPNPTKSGSSYQRLVNHMSHQITSGGGEDGETFRIVLFDEFGISLDRSLELTRVKLSERDISRRAKLYSEEVIGNFLRAHSSDLSRWKKP